MILRSAGPSPFGRKVKIAASLTGTIDRIRVEMTDTMDATDTIRKQNPLGKIPTLILEDGTTLYDSRVINQFLNERAGADLYPKARIWETLTLEATAAGIMDAAILMVYEHRVRPEHLVFDEWIEAQWAKVIRSVGAINARWMSHLNGPLDASHIAVACALSYLDFRQPGRDWRAGHEELAAWHAEFAKRESMLATAPE